MFAAADVHPCSNSVFFSLGFELARSPRALETKVPRCNRCFFPQDGPGRGSVRSPAGHGRCGPRALRVRPDLDGARPGLAEFGAGLDEASTARRWEATESKTYCKRDWERRWVKLNSIKQPAGMHRDWF